MLKLWCVGVLLLAACEDGGKPATDAKSHDSASADAPWPIDAPPPPPTVDAGPPPEVACSDAGVCETPHSTCLDQHWILYYTDGVCTDGACTYTENYLFCTYDCYDGGCIGGFT